MALTALKSRRHVSGIDWLPPFPEGWYLVCTQSDLEKNGLIEKKWMGEDIVAWRDEDGRVCVAEAFCPHLGSHMGPTVGGRIDKGCLVCPFHGYVYNTSGRCVATPNAPPPKTAKLRVFPSRVLSGMVFAWRGEGDRAPDWRLPEDPSSDLEWGEKHSMTLRFRGHPQETTENSVDIEHLAYTHGYTDVEAKGASVDGAYLKSAFNFSTVRKIAGLVSIVTRVEAVTHVYGLGYSYVESRLIDTDMHSRLWVLATPIDGELMDFTIATQVRRFRSQGNFLVGLGFLPAGLRQKMMCRMTLKEVEHYVNQDVIIWERKRFQAPPRLSVEDGPIGLYRRYCRQFYPEYAN